MKPLFQSFKKRVNTEAITEAIVLVTIATMETLRHGCSPTSYLHTVVQQLCVFIYIYIYILSTFISFIQVWTSHSIYNSIIVFTICNYTQIDIYVCKQAVTAIITFDSAINFGTFCCRHFISARVILATSDKLNLTVFCRNISI